MNIDKFKAGTLKKQYGYSSFSPELVNHEWLITDAKINKLLSDTDRKLGELNAFSMLIPDVDYFIKMHIAKEATKSSRIEGTQTSIEEALQNEEYINPEKIYDWKEVHNYIEAMNYAIEPAPPAVVATTCVTQVPALVAKSEVADVPVTAMVWPV